MTLLSLVLAVVLGMQEVPGDAIDRHILDLGSNAIETRDAAARELRKIGAPAVPALQKAVGDADARRAERASMVLQDIEKGVVEAEPEAAAVEAPPQPQVKEGFALQVAEMVIANQAKILDVRQPFALAVPNFMVAPVAVPEVVKLDEKAVADAAEAAKALRKTAQDGFAFKGEVVNTPLDDNGPAAAILKAMGMAKGDPLSGKLSGAAGAPFKAAIRVKSADRGYELFREGGRIMERLTGRAGAIEPPLDAASQVVFLLDLEEMGKSVETFATGVRKGGDVEVEGVKCTRFEISLSEGAIPDTSQAEEDPMTVLVRNSVAPEKAVDVMVWVGDDDGRVHRLQAVFHYKQKNNARGFAGDINYNVILQKHGAAQVEIPVDVKQE